MVTRCASSHLMASLLAWRNPQGAEEKWIGRSLGVENREKHGVKIFFTEIALYAATDPAAFKVKDNS